MTTKAAPKVADVPKPEVASQPAPVGDTKDTTRITPTEAARLRWEIYRLHHQTNKSVKEVLADTDQVVRYVMQQSMPT